MTARNVVSFRPADLFTSDAWVLCPDASRPWLLMALIASCNQEKKGSLPRDVAAASLAMSTPVELFSPHAAAVFRSWRIDGDDVISSIAEKWVEEAARPSDSYRRFRAAVLARWGELCHYCGAVGEPLQLDHVIPRSRGGIDHPDNLVPACQPCNGSKGARTPDEWRPQWRTD